MHDLVHPGGGGTLPPGLVYLWHGSLKLGVDSSEDCSGGPEAQRG